VLFRSRRELLANGRDGDGIAAVEDLGDALEHMKESFRDWVPLPSRTYKLTGRAGAV
jgi:hypothetical protein